MDCRFCGGNSNHKLIDLITAPPSNAYLNKKDLNKPEPFFPLKLFVCLNCRLVQTEDYVRADDLFRSDYTYFSSTSTSWLEHASRYTDMICERLELNHKSYVIEIASNDGYLLRNFVKRKIPCLGIEPTHSTSAAALNRGIPTLRKFFTAALAEQLRKEGRQADLIIGNNVYAHVPDINDFTQGMKTVLKSRGTITLEFPHLLKMIEHNLFDTIYHEHFSYFSLYTVFRIFKSAGLRIFNVEELPSHGGSLRVYGCHDDDPRPDMGAVRKIIAKEERHGLMMPDTYDHFQHQADRIKNDLLAFLIKQKNTKRKVIGYGAAAKGNTLLNYAGIKPDLLPYVCDAASAKQGKFMPGSHIPILSPELIKRDRPDVVLIFPWNIVEEIIHQHHDVFDWGGVFAVAVPNLKIITAADACAGVSEVAIRKVKRRFGQTTRKECRHGNDTLI